MELSLDAQFWAIIDANWSLADQYHLTQWCFELEDLFEHQQRQDQ